MNSGNYNHYFISKTGEKIIGGVEIHAKTHIYTFFMLNELKNVSTG